MNAPRNIRFAVTLTLLSLLAMTLLGHHFILLPIQSAEKIILEEAHADLRKASSGFAQLSREAEKLSHQLADSLSLSGFDKLSSLSESSYFDGISVYHLDSLLAWSGFAPVPNKDDSIVRASNGLRLRQELSFGPDSLQSYRLITEKQIHRRDPLKLLDDSTAETYTHHLLGLNPASPVRFDFTEGTETDLMAKSTLITASGDTAGFAYFNNESLLLKSRLVRAEGKSISSLLIWMLVFILSLSGVFLFRFSNSILNLLLRHLMLGLFLGLVLAGVFSLPLLFFDVTGLAYPAINAVFSLLTLGLILLIQYPLSKLSTEELPSEKACHFYLLYPLLLLMLSLFAVPGIIENIFKHQLYGFHELSILPSLSLFIFYLSCGFFALGWLRLLSVFRFAPVFSKLRRPDFLTLPRFFLLGCLIASALFYGLINAELEKQKKVRIAEYKNEFLNSSVESAQNIIFELVNGAATYLDDLSREDLKNRPAFVQQRLQQGSGVFFRSEWLEYSYDIRLIDADGELIASYSSDLDTPAWTRVFDMSSLVIPYETERITRELNRPIVRSRPYNDLPIKYSSFRRAWIPLYEQDTESNTIIAWVLCTLYKEPSKFEKPLRSLVTLTEQPQSAQDAVLISLYENGNLQRSRVFGFPGSLEHELKLPLDIQQADADSIRILRDFVQENRIEDQYIRTDNGNWLRITQTLQSQDRHIFQITRFFLVIFITGFLMSLILGLAGLESMKIFRKSRRFQHMLIDRVMYAIVICLFGLLLVSSEASEKQNQIRLLSNLENQLDNLADALLLESQIQADEPSLERATFPLSIDASLFEEGRLLESTAPQMYNLNLLPSVVPFKFHRLMQENPREVLTEELNLGGEKILIGYKKLPDSDQIIAIPTFTRSPVYNNLLLSNSSYLLGFYVVIFGLFILASALIARQLTRPIEIVREALGKTGEGSLDTTLPVITEDEIGSLSKAYNEMQSRLKAARDELSKAERDRAWKEMAQQVAHEIKNPLTPMKLSIQHLERKLKSGEYDPEVLNKQVKELTQNIITQINALDKIASDFSTFARPVDQPFENISLNDLMDELISLYGHYEDRNIEIRSPKKKFETRGVADDLRAALINLIKNAIEATPDQGNIRVKLSTRKGEALITVKDDGKGIPEELKSKIFNPNFSTKTSGTGLGLAISHKIIQTHQGSITFSTKKNKGTTFYVYLPLAE